MALERPAGQASRWNDGNIARYARESDSLSPADRSKPGLGFPIARMVGLICLGSGAVLDAAMGPFKGKGGSEHALFRQLLDRLEPGDVVLADRYYCSYWLIAMLLAIGVDVILGRTVYAKPISGKAHDSALAIISSSGQSPVNVQTGWKRRSTSTSRKH